MTSENINMNNNVFQVIDLIRKINGFLFNLFKKTFLTVRGRFIFLIFIPLIINFIFYLIIYFGTYNVYNIMDSSGIYSVPNKSETQQTDISPFLNSFSQFTKLPIFLLNFNLYAKNDFALISTTGEKVPTLLNIEAYEKYTGGIKTHKSKIIYHNYNIVNVLSSYTFKKKFTLEDKYSLSEYYARDIHNSNFSLYILPTPLTVILLWFSTILLLYSFIIIINLCIKFIVSGAPIADTYNEYIKNN